MTHLKGLLISDGRPGHYHLAEGVLAALARLRPVEITRLEVRRRFFMPGRLLARLLAAGVSPERVLALGYGLSRASIPPADVVVSAGGNTLAANIAAARILGVPNIFYGSLRKYSAEDFALVLTSHERLATSERHVMTLKPAPVDPDAVLAMPRREAGVAPRIAGLLIGGDTSTIRFGADDWLRLEGFMRDYAGVHGTRWIAANSPRTPAAANEMLARLAAETEGPLLSFIDFHRAGPGSLGELFQRSEVVLCTVDSSSMLSEAVWMRRPAIAIAPAQSRLPANEADYRRYLESNGWAATIAIAELSPERLDAALRTVLPLAINPLDHLAATLAGRLPRLFRGARSRPT